MSFSLFKRRSFWLAAAYLIGVAAVLYFFFAAYGYDDPYITYRYANNLRHGLGFVFNPGEQVLSTTTPLFAMLLAALGLFVENLPQTANLISAVSIAAGGLLLWQLARQWKLNAASWAALALYPTFSLLLQTTGSETPLYITLGLAALAAYQARRYKTTAVLAALTGLARPDGVLVAGVLGLHYLVFEWRRARAIPWAALAIYLAINLAWYGFAWFYFGYPLPVTLAAKQQQGSMAISQQFFAGFFKVAGWYNTWPYWLELGLAALGAFWCVRRRSPAWLLLAWVAVYFAGYSLLGVSQYFWYYAPLVPGFVLLVSLGVEALWAGRSQWRGWAGVAVLLTLTAAAMQAQDALHLSQVRDTRLPRYTQTGLWLAQNIPAEARVGLLEVGIIGYYAPQSLVDFAGLIQPAVARQLKRETSYDDAALWAVEAYQPEYLALAAGTLPQFREAYVNLHCQPIHLIEDPSEKKINMEIYHCQTAP
ncbi:MAG TPA: hypothetical protein PKW33_17605 [Anaerolineaceae bacterium]|nr:hypothetical protein [Anaerolineaceae bacterium]HPN53415.1 hypothetical protein [Anaerolineaceae bacterium]